MIIKQTPIETVLDALTASGKNPTLSGNGYMACCPAHNDDDPSLAISEGASGKVLLRCFAGCSYEAICESLNLEPQDLFEASEPAAKKLDTTLDRYDAKGSSSSSATSETAQTKTTKKKEKKVHKDISGALSSCIAAVQAKYPNAEPTSDYVYTDEHGEDSVVVIRFDYAKNGKAAKEYRPVSRVDGGWIVGAMPENRPLYNLPAVLAADTVHVCEGEKAADAANELGIVATCSLFGASSPKKTNWKPLEGKNIVIIPDNDDAGKAYVESLLELLDSSSVKILDLPDAGPKDDIYDFIERRKEEGKTLEEIREEVLSLAEAAPLAANYDFCTTNKIQPEKIDPAELYHPKQTFFPETDCGLAERFVFHHGEIVRYICAPEDALYVYDGRRWTKDKSITMHLAKKTARSIRIEANDFFDDKDKRGRLQFAASAESDRKIRASLNQVAAEPNIRADGSEFDVQPHLLNVANGTIDFKKRILLPHDPRHKLTQLCPIEYDPSASCPRWLEYLDAVSCHDAGWVRYVSRILGYAITGYVDLEILVVLVGDGSNGKTTLVETVKKVLGTDFCTSVSSNILLSQKHESHPTDLYSMKGKRLVTSGEIDKGGKLNEALIKRVVSSDSIAARPMYADAQNFDPTHTLFFHTNHKPEIAGRDYGIWRRIKLIPFNKKFEGAEKDGQLREKLMEERQGILAYLVREAFEYCANRCLPEEPEVIAKCYEDYRSEQDVVGSFLAECCDQHPEFEDGRKELHDAYKFYVGASDAMTQRSFNAELEKRGFYKRDSGAKHNFCGLKLRS